MRTYYKIEAKVNGEWVVLVPKMFKKSLVKAFAISCKKGGYRTRVTKINEN